MAEASVSDWLEASYDGEIGWFPVTYAERLENESHQERAVPSSAGAQHQHALCNSYDNSLFLREVS